MINFKMAGGKCFYITIITSGACIGSLVCKEDLSEDS